MHWDRSSRQYFIHWLLRWLLSDAKKILILGRFLIHSKSTKITIKSDVLGWCRFWTYSIPTIRYPITNIIQIWFFILRILNIQSIKFGGGEGNHCSSIISWSRARRGRSYNDVTVSFTFVWTWRRKSKIKSTSELRT